MRQARDLCIDEASTSCGNACNEGLRQLPKVYALERFVLLLHAFAVLLWRCRSCAERYTSLQSDITVARVDWEAYACGDRSRIRRSVPLCNAAPAPACWCLYNLLPDDHPDARHWLKRGSAAWLVALPATNTNCTRLPVSTSMYRAYKTLLCRSLSRKSTPSPLYKRVKRSLPSVFARDCIAAPQRAIV